MIISDEPKIGWNHIHFHDDRDKRTGSGGSLTSVFQPSPHTHYVFAVIRFLLCTLKRTRYNTFSTMQVHTNTRVHIPNNVIRPNEADISRYQVNPKSYLRPRHPSPTLPPCIHTLISRLVTLKYSKKPRKYIFYFFLVLANKSTFLVYCWYYNQYL